MQSQGMRVREAAGEAAEPWRAVVTSERIAAAERELVESDDLADAVEAFWRGVETTPLWERDPELPDAWRVTFLWRGDPELTRHVTLYGSVVFSETFSGKYRFARIPETDIWHLTLRVPPGTRSSYAINPNGTFVVEAGTRDLLGALVQSRATSVRDPLNPRTFLTPVNALWPRFSPELLSVLEAPDAPAQRWRVPQPGVAKGTVEQHEHTSAVLDNTRRVWTYTPPGWHPHERECPLLVTFDGWHAVEVSTLPLVLDNLIAAGEIPPLVAVMVDCGTVEMRGRELDCHEPTVALLAEEIVPWAHARWSLDGDRGRTILAGMSLGGRAAVFTALRRPDVFGKVIAQATAVDESGPTAIDELIRPVSPPDTVEFYFDVGLLEINGGGPRAFLQGTRRLGGLLRAAGHDVHHVELACGHDAIVHGETIADGLRSLLHGADALTQS